MITLSEQPFGSRFPNSIIIDCSEIVLWWKTSVRVGRKNSHFHMPGGFCEVLIYHDFNFLAFVRKKTVSVWSWVLRLKTKLPKIGCRRISVSLFRAFDRLQLYLQFLVIDNLLELLPFGFNVILFWNFRGKFFMYFDRWLWICKVLVWVG